jgi:hypothetical protein
VTGAMIAQLIIALGPVALQIIPELSKIWGTTLTPEQVNTYCAMAQKSYDTYLAEAKAKLPA